MADGRRCDGRPSLLSSGSHTRPNAVIPRLWDTGLAADWLDGPSCHWVLVGLRWPKNSRNLFLWTELIDCSSLHKLHQIVFYIVNFPLSTTELSSCGQSAHSVGNVEKLNMKFYSWINFSGCTGGLLSSVLQYSSVKNQLMHFCTVLIIHFSPFNAWQLVTATLTSQMLHRTIVLVIEGVN